MQGSGGWELNDSPGPQLPIMTDALLAPGLAVQMCLLHLRQYISLCIMQNTAFLEISGCSCTAVNCMYSHGSKRY